MHFDTHVHSQLSPDSEMDPSCAIAVLQRKGMGIVFTEHVDYVTPAEGVDPYAADRPQAPHDFCVDLSAYPCGYFPYKNETVLTGLEIGLNAAYLPLNIKTAGIEGLDFIIGSIHFVDGLDLTGDYYETPPGAVIYYDQPGIDPYARMLEYTREMVALCGFIDSLGHIDYISRYSPLEEKEVKYETYPALYDLLFRVLIDQDKAIEINTSRFGDRTAEANLYRIYKRYHALGGRFVTIGSDAHTPERLGYAYDKALQMTREIGLQPVYFKERKRIYCG